MRRRADADMTDMRPHMLIALTLVVLALTVALATTAFAGRSSAHGCPAALKVAGTQSWRVSAVSCTTARRVVTEVKTIRHSVARYARARRCGRRYCIVVRNFRCRPLVQAQSRERCTHRRQVVSWTWK
jgi:hypothetical protein